MNGVLVVSAIELSANVAEVGWSRRGDVHILRLDYGRKVEKDIIKLPPQLLGAWLKVVAWSPMMRYNEKAGEMVEDSSVQVITRSHIVTEAGIELSVEADSAYIVFEFTPKIREKVKTKVILSFATEVANLPMDYDLIERIAGFLTEKGLVGNFHLTGDYARALKRNGRCDVVAALSKHEIGFHCNHHGARPFMGKYINDKGWRDGVAEWFSNETPGIMAVEELFGKKPLYYTTEFARAPQAVYASYLTGIPMLGFAELPTRGHGAVWFCNSFVPNCDALQSMPVDENDPLNAGKLTFKELEGKLKTGKSDLIRFFQHSYDLYYARPIQWETETPAYYKNDNLYYEDAPHITKLWPQKKQEEAFEAFKKLITHISENAEFLSFSDYLKLFKGNEGQWIKLSELDKIAAFLLENIDAYTTEDVSISPAESFALFVRALRHHHENGKFPDAVFMRNVIGPTQSVDAGAESLTVAPEVLSNALVTLDRMMDNEQYLPASYHIGGSQAGPGQLLRGMLQLYIALREGKAPSELSLSGSNLPAIAEAPYFQSREFVHGSFYPDGFAGENVALISRVQSWSWKPAIAK